MSTRSWVIYCSCLTAWWIIFTSVIGANYHYNRTFYTQVLQETNCTNLIQQNSITYQVQVNINTIQDFPSDPLIFYINAPNSVYGLNTTYTCYFNPFNDQMDLSYFITTSGNTVVSSFWYSGYPMFISNIYGSSASFIFMIIIFVLNCLLSIIFTMKYARRLCIENRNNQQRHTELDTVERPITRAEYDEHRKLLDKVINLLDKVNRTNKEQTDNTNNV